MKEIAKSHQIFFFLLKHVVQQKKCRLLLIFAHFNFYYFSKNKLTLVIVLKSLRIFLGPQRKYLSRQSIQKVPVWCNSTDVGSNPERDHLFSCYYAAAYELGTTPSMPSGNSPDINMRSLGISRKRRKNWVNCLLILLLFLLLLCWYYYCSSK